GLAEGRGDVVHQVPDPGYAEVLQAGHQAQAADPGDVPQVHDVGRELLQLLQQHVDVEGADPVRFGLVQGARDRGAVVKDRLAPDVDQAHGPPDVGRRLDGSPRCRGQYEDLMAARPEGVHGLSAAQLVAADDVRGIEVRQ